MTMQTPAPWLDPDLLAQCAQALKVLAHADRLRIVERLENQRLNVSELAEQIGLPQAAVSQHLGLMKAHGLVACEREGRACFYFVANPQCLNVLDCIRKHHG